MLFYTVGQSRIFLAMLYAGLASGLWYDMLCLARSLFSAGRMLTMLLDGLFGVGAACIAAIALIWANYGDLRLYALMGVLCGFILYLGTLRPVLRHCIRGVARLSARALRWLAGTKIIRKIFR